MSTALKREDEPRAPRPWDGYIPEDELAVYRTAGFGQEVGIGERPALLVIDVQYRSTGRTPAPLPDALTEYPSSCGEAAWHALPHIARLIALFRKLGFPVLYPYVAPKSQHSAGQFEAKILRSTQACRANLRLNCYGRHKPTGPICGKIFKVDTGTKSQFEAKFSRSTSKTYSWRIEGLIFSKQ